MKISNLKLKIGFIGLGRMGKAMVEHLLEGGVDVVVYNRSSVKTDELKSKVKSQKSKIQIKNKKLGELISTYTINELVSKLEKPRVIWLMVPHGKPIDEMIEKLLGDPEVSREIHIRSELDRTPRLVAGDIIIDGGNSFYKDSVRRFYQLEKREIHFLDVGTSGGLEGARRGACLMIGGERSIYEKLIPLFKILAGKMGDYAYFGPSGAGHFVKMVHNGVEYGMLEALGEGFDILFNGPYQLDLAKVAHNWSKRSVVRGWLVELLEDALKKDANLTGFTGKVGGGETGEWTIKTAKELGIETSVLEDAVTVRKKSLENPNFSGKVISALRREFGGHEEK